MTAYEGPPYGARMRRRLASERARVIDSHPGRPRRPSGAWKVRAEAIMRGWLVVPPPPPDVAPPPPDEPGWWRRRR